jgi:glutamate-1-semialdehyde 2,1-aminomutase
MLKIVDVVGPWAIWCGIMPALTPVTWRGVTWRQTLGGGMPVGVVCGPKRLMARFDPNRPLRVAYVIGTFSAHPLTLAAMAEFLLWVEKPETKALYASFHSRFDKWIAHANEVLRAEGLPVQLANLTSVWTILFTQSGRYNWMLQYYLRAQGVSMAWVGTGRLLASISFTDEDLADMLSKLLAAAKAMKRDGWWWTGATAGSIGMRIAGEMIRNSAIGIVRDSIVCDVLALPEDYDPAASRRRAPKGMVAFYHEVMRRKEDDHKASHSNVVNQFCHLISSSMFIYCYATVFGDRCTAMWLGIFSLTIRQMGHAIFEPPCHDKEELLLGFNTRAKCFVFSTYILSGLVRHDPSGMEPTGRGFDSFMSHMQRRESQNLDQNP